MDRAQRLLPLKTGTVRPAPGLPMLPRASGTQGTRSLTKRSTSPTEVNPNWDPGNWSLWKASGWKPTDWGRKMFTSNWAGKTSTLNQGGKMSTSNHGGKPASAGRAKKQTASGGQVDLPPEREGAGDGAWSDWYQRTLQGAEGGTSEPQGPPCPIGTAQVRWEAIGQIYNCVDGKDLSPCNIASEALWVYYSGVNPQTLKTWACQILCMISEYHKACMTSGSPVTSPILPRVIEDRLPPLTDYTLPEDRSGVTDVMVWDHQARTLRIAVWFHRLDMALSEELAASRSLVRA